MQGKPISWSSIIEVLPMVCGTYPEFANNEDKACLPACIREAILAGLSKLPLYTDTTSSLYLVCQFSFSLTDCAACCCFFSSSRTLSKFFMVSVYRYRLQERNAQVSLVSGSKDSQCAIFFHLSHILPIGDS